MVHPSRPDRAADPGPDDRSRPDRPGREADQPFALFIEAGDVDFALHANNLDNAVGAILQR